jgi:hypothetical protein
MKLTTKEIVAEFKQYPFHSQEKLGGAAHVICAFRLPSQTWYYYVLEADEYNLDEDMAMATKLKAGGTWWLRGVMFDEEHPHGEYTLALLAEIEQRKKFTAIRNKDTGEEEYIEERAERIKEFVPCSVADIVPHMEELTADEYCMDMLAAVNTRVHIEEAVRKIEREAEDTEE